MAGPISPHPSRAVIPEPEAAAFLDASGAQGLVLVSFGSSPVYGTCLQVQDYIGLAEAFADLAPVRVMWLLNPKLLPEGVKYDDLPIGQNTLVLPWAHVNDVLGHPSCRAFVTHGGEWHPCFVVM